MSLERAIQRRDVARARAAVIQREQSGTIPGREVVLKLISTTKSAASARRMIQYVARVRREDAGRSDLARVRLYDELGAPLARVEPGEPYAETRRRVAEAVAGFGLKPDADNLSARGRQQLEGGEGEKLPPARRLRHRQAFHFTFSLPVGRPQDLELVELAAATAIREAFAAEGYRALWAMHDEAVAGARAAGHAHAHIHIVVKAQSEEGARRLRFDPRGEELQRLRRLFAAAAEQAGLACTATQREDRAELREAVAAGREPLRPHQELYQRQTGPRTRDPYLRVPRWAAAEMGAARRRQAEAAERARRGFPRWRPKPAEPAARRPSVLGRLWRGRAEEPARREGPLSALERAVEATFHDPAAAVASWRAMRAEDARFADWYMTHRPEIFGEVTDRAFIRRGRGGPVSRHLAIPGFAQLLEQEARRAPPAPAGIEGPAAEAERQRALDAARAAQRQRRTQRIVLDLRRIDRSLSAVSRDLEAVGPDPAALPAQRAIAMALRRVYEAAAVAVGPAAAPPVRPSPGPRRPPLRPRERDRGDRTR